MAKGLFLVLEGLDNCGKTTQAKLLKEALEARGWQVIHSHEPGGTEVGEEIRKILLKPNRSKPIPPLAQAFLFNASRVEFLNDIVKPNLDSGTAVISDRYVASTFAYQGFGEGVDLEVLEKLHQMVTADFGREPDLYVIIDIPVEESIKRTNNPDKSDQVWAYEQKGPEFAERVRQGYLDYAKKFSLPVIDGLQDQETIHQQLMALVDGLKI